MRTVTVGGMLSVWLVGVLGCGPAGGTGGDAGVQPGGPPPATAAAFCERVEAINLDATMRCYGGTAADWPIFFGKSQCPSLDQAVADHRLTYDATKAAACLTELSKPSACSADSPKGPYCSESVLIGGVADGQPCDSSFVCRVGSGCTFSGVPYDSCPVLTCQHFPVAGEKCITSWGVSTCAFGFSCVGDTCVPNLKAGASCGQPDQAYCGENLYCSEGAGPTCKRSVEGGACPTGLECLQYQYCDSTRHCHARLPIGGDCSADSSSCQTFTACDPTTHRCVEASHLGQLCGNLVGLPFMCQGGSCVDDADHVSHCVAPVAEGGACTSDLECSPGLCTAGKCAAPTPNDGAPCTDDTFCFSGKCSAEGMCDDGSNCMNALKCTSNLCSAGKCVARSPNGDPCTFPFDCESGACTGNVCMPQVANGMACADGTDCVSGHCADGKCAACM